MTCCMMGRVSHPDPAVPPGVDDAPSHSGTRFVIGVGIVLVLLLAVLLVISPRLQNRLGLTGDPRTFPTPEEVVEVPLTLQGREVGVAIHDARGVCAEITDSADETFRTCAVPDPLRPIWAIDAPETADPPYVIVAGPPAVASVAGITTDGRSLSGLTQARELPAAWTLIPLPPGAAVSELVAYNAENSDLGNAECDTEEAPTDGSERLAGGCIIPRQD